MKRIEISYRIEFEREVYMAKLLTRCPVCEGGFNVTELTCRRCNARVSSTFESCRFCTLSAEHLAFIEVFLRSEGNLTRVEKELGVSYPTVRNRLTGALAALGLSAQPPAEPEPPQAPAAEAETGDLSARRTEALNALARGEISAEDAARILRELS